MFDGAESHLQNVLAYPPQLDGLVIGGQKHPAATGVSAPFDLVDLLFYL